METSTSEEERLVQSPSKKEVRFCDETRILYYPVEDSVDSLNEIPTMDKISNSPNACCLIKDSTKGTGSCVECLPNQRLDDLPEAVVILKKLPEDLIQKHIYLDVETTEVSGVKSCSVPTAIQSVDQACPYSSDLLHEEMTESKESEIFSVIIKEENPLLHLEVSIPIPRLPDTFTEIYESENNGSETSPIINTCSKNSSPEVSELNGIIVNVKTKSNELSRNLNTKRSDLNAESTTENSFLHNSLPSPLDIETSKCVSKTCTQVIEMAKSLGSDSSVFKKYISSQKNRSRVVFDKYPCVHLDKLDFESYLESISHTDEPTDIDTGTVTNVSDLLKPKHSVQLNEDICSLAANLSALVINGDSPKKSPSKLKLEKNIGEKICSKNVRLSAPVIDVEGTKNVASTSGFRKRKRSVALNKEVCSEYVDSVVPTCKKRSKGKSLKKSKKKSKNTNCENSSFYTCVQNNLPYVVLERLPLSLLEMYVNDDGKSGTNLPAGTNPPIATDFDVPDMPIQIGNVCSISRRTFNKTQNKRMFSTKSSLSRKLTHSRTVQEFDDSSSDDLSLVNLAKSKASLNKAKRSHTKTDDRKTKKSSAMQKKNTNSEVLRSISNKTLKNSQSIEISYSEKKKKKKSSKKKKLKIYKMIMKYLRMQMKSKKRKKKSSKRKNLEKNSKKLESQNLAPANLKSDTESNDSVALVYDSNAKKKNCAQNKNHGESSTSEKTKLGKKSVDKYRLGFLSNKVSLRFYNRFLASERLLLSKSKLKKNKKKELKKIFNRLKAVGLAGKIV